MNYDAMKKETERKFRTMDFKPGDIFSEMLSHWKVIIRIEDNELTIISGSHTNLKLEHLTKEEFKYNCSYKNIDGYCIDFMKNNPDKIKDYIEAFIEQQKMSLDKIREFKLDLLL